MDEQIERVSARRALLAKQQQWADACGLLLDSRGYAHAYEPNLFRPLSNEALRCFKNGSGSELRDGGTRPAKMRAVHSSSALAANVFDYWVERPTVALQLLALPGEALSLRFEAQFSTGLPGEPPNLDLCIERAGAPRVAIESKFCEWLTPHRQVAKPFKDKYFAHEAGAWTAMGLPRCQLLAQQMQSGQVAFRYLNAAQLLKHALGLATTREPFELVYLFFDAPGPESDQHAAEVDVFASRVQADLPFHVRTYQQVLDRLGHLAGPADSEYVTYIRTRYMR